MPDITDQIVDFYDALFKGIFFKPFAAHIAERRRRDAVQFQILEAGGAASQSLERFFVSQQLNADEVSCVLGALASTAHLNLERVANPNTPPERIVEDLLTLPSCSGHLEEVVQAKQEAVYRVSLYSVVQGLMQIGPVMAEWQKMGFPATFELSRRIIARLNSISEQLDVLGLAGTEAADERYELQYRDYLSQRFNRVEAGTVRMTTNQSVDLPELFVMPNVFERSIETKPGVATDSTELMPLARAREALEAFDKRGTASEKKGIPILEQVRRRQRNVIVGAPGTGKSTFLEWFQLRIADAKEEFVLSGRQAILVLLRVRQLDPDNLPTGSGLIEKAAGSHDFAALMPDGWIHRQMSAGIVMFMLDGLDEVDPHVRDSHLAPWFKNLGERYPRCSFIVSSRPVGYPAGLLRDLGFSESELLDFDETQVAEYAGHWCTAIRLARNEPQAEARREGAEDGARIVSGFKGHPYIKSLARNPLMLSAICLVNYFEGGQLPKDRAVLYRLCVEGLLHNWDQRRGILSDFTFEEKLRLTREVALRMQSDDRAEYELAKVQEVFSVLLKDEERAVVLLEHIRYRTGLLLERRPGVFAFAHLTFQEYLAARAVYEGNQTGIETKQLVRAHGDARWQEVIALYCGVAPAPEARRTIEALVRQNASARLLGEAYFSAGPELAQDARLRHELMKGVANADIDWGAVIRFTDEEFAPVANEAVGQTARDRLSVACHWLGLHSHLIDATQILERTKQQFEVKGAGLRELNLLVHYMGSDDLVGQVAKIPGLYDAIAPPPYGTQASISFEALTHRNRESPPDADESVQGADLAWGRALDAILRSTNLEFRHISYGPAGPSRTAWPSCAPLLRRIMKRVTGKDLEAWFERVNQEYGVGPANRVRPQPEKPKQRRK